MFKIVSLLSIIASACAGGLDEYVIPDSPGLVNYGSPYLSSRLVGPSVLSLPSVATQHVTVARPASLAVERVSVGSVPHLSVVNEPTTIVTPGKPIRGHSFTSEVRHDSVARYAAPLLAYGSPALATVEGPAISEVVDTRSFGAPVLAHRSSDVFLSSPLQTVVSAPQIYATGAASVVAGPVAVKGYTRETGRTELVNEVRLRTAHIPTTIVQDSVVQSVPTVLSQPLVTKGVWGTPLLNSYSTLIKK